MAKQKLQEALDVLKREVQEYPEFWNGFETLAEVYMNLGERQMAIKNDEKSLALNPDNWFGLQSLKKLQEQAK